MCIKGNLGRDSAVLLVSTGGGNWRSYLCYWAWLCTGKDLTGHLALRLLLGTPPHEAPCIQNDANVSESALHDMPHLPCLRNIWTMLCRPAFLLLQRDVTEQIEMENLLAELVEDQLAMLSQVGEKHA